MMPFRHDGLDLMCGVETRCAQLSPVATKSRGLTPNTPLEAHKEGV